MVIESLARTVLGDPVTTLATCIGLASLLLSAALHKLQQPRAFEAALAGYGIVPAGLLAPARRLVPLAEAAIALGLLLPSTQSLAAQLAAALLLLYALAMVLALHRGTRIADCGCSLGRARQSVSWALAWRNLVLALLALNAAWGTHPRGLGIYDWTLVVLIALVGIVFYALVNTLIAGQSSTRDILQ